MRNRQPAEPKQPRKRHKPKVITEGQVTKFLCTDADLLQVAERDGLIKITATLGQGSGLHVEPDEPNQTLYLYVTARKARSLIHALELAISKRPDISF